MMQNIPAGNEINGHKAAILARSKARYERGLKLYADGAVSINPKGYGFVVNGNVVDTETVKCDCLDYKHTREACKHFFAACVFQKNGCKAVKRG